MSLKDLVLTKEEHKIYETGKIDGVAELIQRLTMAVTHDEMEEYFVELSERITLIAKTVNARVDKLERELSND